MTIRVCATRIEPFNADKSVNVKFIDELNRVDPTNPVLKMDDLMRDNVQASTDGLIVTFPFKSGKTYQIHVKTDPDNKLFYEIFKIASKPLPSALEGVTARPASGGVVYQPSSAFDPSCAVDSKKPDKSKKSDDWLDHETKTQQGYLYGVKKNERKFLAKVKKLAKEKHLDEEETHNLLVSSLKAFRKGKKDRADEASKKILKEVTAETLREMFPGYREPSSSQTTTRAKPKSDGTKKKGN